MTRIYQQPQRGSSARLIFRMAEAPIMPFYTDAYLADTGHLTTIEHGAYLLLLFTMWRGGGSLDSDPKKLARYCKLTPGQFKKIWDSIEPFFHVEDGQLYQGKLQENLEAVRRKSQSARDSARAKWRKTKETGDANASNSQCGSDAIHKPLSNKKKNTKKSLQEKSDVQEGLPLPSQPDSKPQDGTILFKEAWGKVREGKRVNRKGAMTKWNAAKKKVPEATLLAKWTEYVDATADREIKYVKLMANWLGQEGWTDEVPKCEAKKPSGVQTDAERAMVRARQEQRAREQNPW